MDSRERREWVAELVRRLLDEESAPRCKIVPFPIKPARSPLRELGARLNPEQEQ